MAVQRVLSVDDNAQRAMAEEIERKRPGWMVTWGPYTKGYTAFPLFSVCRRVILFGYTPDALITAIDEAEERYRVQSPGTAAGPAARPPGRMTDQLPNRRIASEDDRHPRADDR
jgi:hypothetical protein